MNEPHRVLFLWTGPVLSVIPVQLCHSHPHFSCQLPLFRAILTLPLFVIPAKAGIQVPLALVFPR